MAGRSIYRAKALQRRALRAERPLPPPPVPSARALALMWTLLLLALVGLAAIGSRLSLTLDLTQLGAAPEEED